MMGPGTSEGPFGYCLNTSTVREHDLSLPQVFEQAARIGYDGVEPWIRELEDYGHGGGTVRDLGKRATDLGLLIPNVIGFFEWAVDDDERRAAGLEEARRCMDIASQVGCGYLAAPPSGVTDTTGISPATLAERYDELAEIGDDYGVTPMIEFWGISKTLGTLGEALQVGGAHARLVALAIHAAHRQHPHQVVATAAQGQQGPGAHRLAGGGGEQPAAGLRLAGGAEQGGGPAGE